MKKLLVQEKLLAIALSIMLLGGCKNNSTSPPPAGNTSSDTVTVVDFSFNPQTLTIAKGTTVVWNNTSVSTHTSTSNTNVWNTGDITPGTSKTITFDSTGTFPYHCIHHPTLMTGTIIVQ